MQIAAIILWVYGVLVLAGGVMGWVKARSKPSLISGVVFGIALILTGFFIDQPACRWTALVLTAALTVLMGARFVKTKRFMPAGMVALLGLIVFIALMALR